MRGGEKKETTLTPAARKSLEGRDGLRDGDGRFYGNEEVARSPSIAVLNAA